METEKKALIFNAVAILTSLFILLTGPLFVKENFTFVLVQIFGALLILWAYISIKVRNKQEEKKLPQGYFYVTHGPYEIIRHPIYAGYLLIFSSFVEYDFTIPRTLAFLALIAVVFLKILREENTMEHEVKEYGEYENKTKRLIPYLF